MFKQIAQAAVAAFVLASGTLYAADDAQHKGGATQAAPAGEEMSEGVVRKVDADAGKLTIKHGALKNLEMPPMTMVFRVKDPAMLGRVKPGDKVNFVAERIGGALTLTRIEAAK